MFQSGILFLKKIFNFRLISDRFRSEFSDRFRSEFSDRFPTIIAVGRVLYIQKRINPNPYPPPLDEIASLFHPHLRRSPHLVLRRSPPPFSVDLAVPAFRSLSLSLSLENLSRCKFYDFRLFSLGFRANDFSL